MTMRGFAVRTLAIAVIAGALAVGTTRSAMAIGGSQVFNPANDHYYERVDYVTPGITWGDAKAVAEAMTAFGLPGYMATITSSDENDFVTNNLGGLALASHWLGGFKPAGQTTYSWITGEPFTYTNWYTPDSADFTTDNDEGVMFSWYDNRPDATGKWMTTTQITPGLVPGQLGFVVEYDASVSVGPVHDLANNHYYERVETSPITFLQAQTAAAAKTYNGWKGHLAAISSQDENDFIINNLGGAGCCGRWLGGYRSSGGWTWVTGETWTNGLTFTNWQSGSPAASPAGPEGLVFDSTGKTTPSALGTWTDTSWSGTAPGYIVEYEPGTQPTYLSLYLTTGTLDTNVTFATLLVSKGKPVVGRTVQFYCEGVPAGSGVTNSSGKAVSSPAYYLPIALGAGMHNVTASYDGSLDSTYLSSIRTTLALNARKIQTSLSLYAASGKTGDTVQLKAILMGHGVRLANKSVTFKVSNTPAVTGVTDVNGVASASYVIPGTLASGVWTVTATFDGTTDTAYATGTRSTPALTVEALAPVIFSLYPASGTAGGTATLATLMYSRGAPLVGKLVTFQVDGTGATVSGTTDATGKASATYSIPGDMAKGTHSVTASFAGDSTYLASSRTSVALTVK